MEQGMDWAGIPFAMKLDRDGRGRVVRKTEHVAGGEERTLDYIFDRSGRLVMVEGQHGPVETYRYEDGLRVEAKLAEPTFHMQHLHYQRITGRAPRLVNLDNTWIAHDDNGFRFHVERDDPNGREQEFYRYAPDYRLLEVRKGGLAITFDHDADGRRCAKYVNGQLEEQYAWLDLVRLAAFRSHAGEVRFQYRDNERIPWAMTLNGRPFLIYSDQVGSVRVVADEQGRVIQEVRYCSFGRLLEEANPGFPMPLGFAGGLHDRDVGWVRFGYRDYDPETGRFTAPDPLGYAAGDPDLYGYCLDDPVNLVDPRGLQIALPYPPPLPGPYSVPGAEEAADAVWSMLQGVFGEDEDPNLYYEEHKKKGSTNPSNIPKHERGESRRKRDKPGGEKGDRRRKRHK